MNLHSTILVAIGAASMSTLVNAAEPAPTPTELFSIVSAARVSASSERIVDPGAFARENLEDTLRGIDAAASRAHTDGLDWERDALLAGLTVLNTFDAVYSVELSVTHVDPTALRMQVTNCGRPSVLTIGFRLEEGLWRMHSFDFDSRMQATSWYRASLKPLQSWTHVPARDRSRYFNESNLGKALDFKFAPKKDDCI
jgi:hypothetical protein